LAGTILAPSPCIDYRGNAGARVIKSQIIGYTVSSNRDTSVIVDFDASENRLEPKPPSIELFK
jgi:hypothetical protein